MEQGHTLKASSGTASHDAGSQGVLWEWGDQNLAGLTWKSSLEEVLAKQDMNEERRQI